jgi:hypothetical protein
MAILQQNRPSSDLLCFLAHHFFPRAGLQGRQVEKCTGMYGSAQNPVPLRRMVFPNTDHESRP